MPVGVLLLMKTGCQETQPSLASRLLQLHAALTPSYDNCAVAPLLNPDPCL